MASNSLTILGSSSGLPLPDRACSGYLLQIGDSLNLIDCGGGVTSSFLRCGFDPIKLDRVFISHSHSDHVCELSLVIQMLHVLKSGRTLELYLPDEFVGPFRDWLNAVYMFPGRIAPVLDIRGYREGVVFDSEFKVTAIGNSHFASVAEFVKQMKLPNQLQCHSFRIDAGGKSLFYSADIGSIEDIRSEMHELDYAVVESTHIDLTEVISHVRSSSVKRWILTHLGNHNEVDSLRQEIAQAGIDNMVIAEEGMRLEL